MAPYMVKFKKTRKNIIFLAYEHRMPNANELARFAEALPSLSNQAQDEYQRLMNTNASKRAQCHAFLNIAERERFI